LSANVGQREQPVVRVQDAGPERIAELEPLWASMHAHHSALAGELPGTRSVPDSWARRRAQYESWLAGGNACLLVAEAGGEALGYAFVTWGEGPPTWDIGDKVAELESLAVEDRHRGAGVGSALLAAAREVALSSGARQMGIGVAHSNAGALRFYERNGFRPFYSLMLGETAR
jgi:GNAT superfamily N-acetyltransferase